MRVTSVVATLAVVLACVAMAASYAEAAPRPPGTLLLNMLIKNEAEHLDRTLPAWAKIIDAWIIGVDDHNTDNSEEVIRRHLGHIPGQVVIVTFDGMGPTWSVLVKRGLEVFPNITHGILADADFRPMSDKLDKMELDIRCSKHMYTIWTQDHRNERKMDWIYRNIPGAVVKRRTHQILEVPPLPNQEVFQTLIGLNVDEREGGYGDRSGTKNQRYIEWLEKDLLEYPGDTRTLYYLGYAHFDIYNHNKDNPKQEHWDHLAKGVEYFKTRAATTGGNSEELWFALLKLGEIYERFYKDWTTSEKYYTNCSKSDPERADAWFYLGQHYRLAGQVEQSLPYLEKAASLPIPQRSLFQWHYLYNCLSKLEYGRAVLAQDKPKRSQLKRTRRLLAVADCYGGDPGNLGELRSMREVVELKLKKPGKAGESETAAALNRLLEFVSKNLDDLEGALKRRIPEDDIPPALSDSDSDYVGNSKGVTYMRVLLRKIAKVQELADTIKAQGAAAVTCRRYRLVTTPYLKFYKHFGGQIARLVNDDDLVEKWQKLNTLVRGTCR